MNIFGEELNIVSRDHCQSGTNQIISVLSPVTLVLQGGGMSKKRFRKRNCKTKKRK
jgi:hypothetical protein